MVAVIPKTMANDSSAKGKMSVLLLSLLFAMSFATVAVANPSAGGSMSGDSGNGYMMTASISQPSNADGSYSANNDYIMIDLNVTGLSENGDYNVHWRFMNMTDGSMLHSMWDNWTESDTDGHATIWANYMPMDAGCIGFGADLMIENTDTNGTTSLLNEAWVHMMIAVDVDPANCQGGVGPGPGPGPGQGWIVTADYDDMRNEVDWYVGNLSDADHTTLDLYVVDQNIDMNFDMNEVWHIIDSMWMNGTAPPTSWNNILNHPITGMESDSGSIPLDAAMADGCYGLVAILQDNGSTSAAGGFIVDFDEWTLPYDSHTQCNNWFDHHGPQGPGAEVWMHMNEFHHEFGDQIVADIEFKNMVLHESYPWTLDVYWVDETPQHNDMHWDPMDSNDLDPANIMLELSQTGMASHDGSDHGDHHDMLDYDLTNGEIVLEGCYFAMIKLSGADGEVISADGQHFEVGEWQCMDEPPMPKMELNIEGVVCHKIDNHDHSDHMDGNHDGHDDGNHDGDHGDSQDEMCGLAPEVVSSEYLDWNGMIMDLPMNASVEFCLGHSMTDLMGHHDGMGAVTWTCEDTNTDNNGIAQVSGQIDVGHNQMNMVMLYVMWEHDDGEHHNGNNVSGHEQNDQGEDCGEGTDDTNCNGIDDAFDDDDEWDNDEDDHNNHNDDEMICYDSANHDVEPIHNKQECEDAGFMWTHNPHGDGDDHHDSMNMPDSMMNHMMSGEPTMSEHLIFCSGPLCAYMNDDNGDQLENVLMQNMGPVKAEVWFEQWTDNEGAINAHMVQHLSTKLREFVDGVLGNSDGSVDLHEAEMFGMIFGGDGGHSTSYGMSADECADVNGDYHVNEPGDEDPHCHFQDTSLNDNETWTFDGVDLGKPDYQWEFLDIMSLVGPVPASGEEAEYSIVWDNGLGWDLDGLSSWASTDTHTLVFTDTDGFIDPCGEDFGAYGDVIAGDSATWSVKSASGNNGWTFAMNENGDAKAAFSCILTPEAVTEFTIVYEKQFEDVNPGNIDETTVDKENETFSIAENSPPVCELYWTEKSGNETSPDYETDTKFEENPNGDYTVELADGASYFIHMLCFDPDQDMIQSTWSVGGIAMDSHLGVAGEEGVWGWVEFAVPEGVGGTVTIDYAWFSGEHTGNGSVVVTATGDGSGGDLTESIVESAGEGALPGFTTAITAVAALVGALVIARRD